jgi:hypothetical protein
MKIIWTAALSVLALAAGAAPTTAAGYWDGGQVVSDPGPPPSDDPACCPCGCPDQAQASVDNVAYAEEVSTPDEFFDTGGGVGPDTFIDEGGGGVVFTNGINVASLFGRPGFEFFDHDRFHRHDHDMVIHHGPPMHHFQPPMRGWIGMSGGVGHMGGFRGPMVVRRGGGGRRW